MRHLKSQLTGMELWMLQWLFWVEIATRPKTQHVIQYNEPTSVSGLEISLHMVLKKRHPFWHISTWTLKVNILSARCPAPDRSRCIGPCLGAAYVRMQPSKLPGMGLSPPRGEIDILSWELIGNLTVQPGQFL